jgi:glycosyltransferase involved in cell wall biosynthesis
MRVCLIGDFTGELDEGFKNVTHYLDSALAKGHELSRLNLKRPLDRSFWRRDLPKPEVIHYLTAPTLLSFVLLALVRLRWPGVPTVVSALHPSSLRLAESPLLRALVSLSRPTCVLVQAARSAAMFRRLGCRVEFLPNGVSTLRFVPVSAGAQRALREKHGLDTGRFTILHVGHLSRTRNVQVMARLQVADHQVLVVGSTYLGEDRALSASLEEQGCIVWRGYVPHIEEVYALADCFVLPTPIQCSLFMPLSVLEAMACNLPVISTPFDGLLHYFQAGEGLIFVEESQISGALVEWQRNGLSANTRSKVEPFSWDEIARQLSGLYQGLLDGGQS